MDQTIKTRHAAILARCSSEANVCSQILQLKQFAAGRYIVNDDDIYGDNISSSSLLTERTELQRLMRNIDQYKKKYDVVLIQDASGLGKTQEQIELITKWFAERNIPLYFQQ